MGRRIHGLKAIIVSHNALKTLKIGRLDFDLAQIFSFFFHLLDKEYLSGVLGFLLVIERMTSLSEFEGQKSIYRWSRFSIYKTTLI